MNRKHNSKTPSSAHRQWHEDKETLGEGTGLTRVPPPWIGHRQALLSLRSRLLDNHEEQALEASEPLEANPNAPAEAGTDAFDHDMSFALLAHEEEMLREIDAALTRIATGTYGICEESGEPIAAARMRAIPWTRYTKHVAERLEHQGQSPGPHLGTLRFVSGRAFADREPAEEKDGIALDRAGEACMSDTGLDENIDTITEEDAITSQERKARA